MNIFKISAVGLLICLLCDGVAQGAPAGRGGVKTLAELTPGHKFELLEKVSFPLPPVFKFLKVIPLLQVTAKTFSIIKEMKTDDPVCVVTGLTLHQFEGDQVVFEKGATFEVKSVEVSRQKHKLYAGSSVGFRVKATGAPLDSKFRCYAGKGVTGVMTIEALEKVFRGKIKFTAPQKK